MVARFAEPKDHRTLIEAIEKLPQNYHLILVGEGPLLEQSKKLTTYLSLEDRIHYLGFRSDVYQILKTLDIIVLSSDYEGLSLSALEGMAAGKPFLASNVQGLKELVESTGILFEN